MSRRRIAVRSVLVAAMILTVSVVAGAAAAATGSAAEYRVVCPDEGAGLDIVDVLEATGEHGTFLELLHRFDPEGLAILSDVELADKTVWAPTDAAFLALGDALSSLPDEQVKAVLGYHISPPRRSPGGAYPVVTPQLLIDAGEMDHRTRTGVLTGSDQRTRTTFEGGALRIEGIRIGSTAWCTEAGSVLSLDAVITDVAMPSTLTWMWNRLVRILLYDDIRFVIYATVGAVSIGMIVSRVVARRSRRTQDGAAHGDDR
jgi:uncharacterized surface protein with fasciclin (FAS1) repeats